MIPIADENPARLKPVFTWSIILLCIAVFFCQVFYQTDDDPLLTSYGFVPREFFAQAETSLFPWETLFTSMFMHGGFFHLGGNMLYLWIFRNNVEDAMGHSRFIFFYLLCGVVAALTEGFAEPSLAVPMLGASGAISGVLAAYVMIFPRARVTVIIPLGILLYPVKISAFYVVGFWFLLQLLNVFSVAPGAPGTAWGAHIGGFIAGLLLTPVLSRFPLFGRQPPGPWG